MITIWFRWVSQFDSKDINFQPYLSSRFNLCKRLVRGFVWISFQQLRLARRTSYWQLIQKKLHTMPCNRVQLTRKTRFLSSVWFTLPALNFQPEKSFVQAHKILASAKKSDNLQYNMLVRSFFSWFLAKFFAKNMSIFFYKFKE